MVLVDWYIHDYASGALFLHWLKWYPFYLSIGSEDIDISTVVKANEHDQIRGASGSWLNLEKDIGFLHDTFLTHVVTTCNILYHLFCLKQICYVGSSWNKPKTFSRRSEPNQKRQSQKMLWSLSISRFRSQENNSVISSLPQFQIPSILISLPRTHLQRHSSNTLNPCIYLWLQWRLCRW